MSGHWPNLEDLDSREGWSWGSRSVVCPWPPIFCSWRCMPCIQRSLGLAGIDITGFSVPAGSWQLVRLLNSIVVWVIYTSVTLICSFGSDSLESPTDYRPEELGAVRWAIRFYPPVCGAAIPVPMPDPVETQGCVLCFLCNPHNPVLIGSAWLTLPQQTCLEKSHWKPTAERLPMSAFHKKKRIWLCSMKNTTRVGEGNHICCCKFLSYTLSKHTGSCHAPK